MVGQVRPGGDPVLSLRAASKRYDAALALSPVSLTLHPGTISLVTGHNGSGKSTLLRVAAGLLRPSSGAREAPGRSLYLLSGHGARMVESSRAAVATAARLVGVLARAKPRRLRPPRSTRSGSRRSPTARWARCPPGSGPA